MRKLCAALLFFLIPSLVFAAGFAKQSLFLSQSSVAEGNTVFIYAVVENDAGTSFSGTLKFVDQLGPIGLTPVTLQAGSAATFSVSWKPAAGSHIVSATLGNLSGQTIESYKATFVVHQAQPHAADAATSSQAANALLDLTLNPPKASTSIQSSEPMQQWIAHFAPPIASVTAPVFSSVDSARLASAQKLANGNAWAQDALSNAATAPGGWLNTLWLIVMTIFLYLCSTLGYVVKNIGIFYPLIAFIFLYILWRIYKLVRGKRDYYYN